MSELIYIDREFIILEYEKSHKKAPIKYTKSTRVDAGISIGAKIGGTLIENFEYDLRPHEMFKECRKSLSEYPQCLKLNDIHEKKCNDVFWLEGIFGTSTTETTSGGHMTEKYSYFALTQEGCDCDKQLPLVLDNSNFASGYSNIFDAPAIGAFTIKAKMLIKILGYDMRRKKPIISPMIVEKIDNYYGKNEK